jgi:Na+-driven multidrug efflux pump
MNDIYYVTFLVEIILRFIIIIVICILPTFIFSFYKNSKKDNYIPVVGHMLLLLLLISYIFKLIIIIFNKKIRLMKKNDIYKEEKLNYNNSYIEFIDFLLFL